MELVKYQAHIAGQWVNAASGDFFETDNPYTGKAWAVKGVVSGIFAATATEVPNPFVQR